MFAATARHDGSVRPVSGAKRGEDDVFSAAQRCGAHSNERLAAEARDVEYVHELHNRMRCPRRSAWSHWLRPVMHHGGSKRMGV